MTSTPILEKVLHFLKPLPSDIPCLGIVLGRESLWALCAKKEKEKTSVEWSERFALETVLFSKEEPPAEEASLVSVLKSIRQKCGKSFFDLQVALPDPAFKFEVFELEKIPASGSAMREYLNWRFNPEKDPAAVPLAFTTQSLGAEEGKNLLWACAVERRWLDFVNRHLRLAGFQASVVDTALSNRFNFCYETLGAQKLGGALVAFEPDYWSLTLWDGQIRPRFARSKWWKKEISLAKEIPLESTILEIERTIRSYVHSGKSRGVESLFVTAPEDWLQPVLKALNQRTEGHCVGLSVCDSFFTPRDASLKGTSPSVFAAAVRR